MSTSNGLLEAVVQVDAPKLFTFNGFGTTLVGRLDDERLPDGLYFSQLFLSAFSIPLIPLSFYLVSEVEHDTYQFFGKIAFRDLRREVGRGTIWSFYRNLLLHGLMLLLIGVAVMAVVWFFFVDLE